MQEETPEEGRIINEDIQPLNRIINYCLVENHTTTLKQEFVKLLPMILTSSTVFILYVEPSEKEADGNKARAIQNVIGTGTTASLVLFRATDIFLDMLRTQIAPEALKDILVTPSKKQRIIEYIVIGITSAISSIPLVFVGYYFNLTDKLYFLIPESIVLLIDNTVLHFLPVKLTLSKPIYRLPLLPFEGIYHWIRQSCMSSKALLSQRFNEFKHNAQMQLKWAFISKLTEVIEDIIQKDFSFDWWTLSYQQRAELPNFNNTENALTDLAEFISPRRQSYAVDPRVQDEESPIVPKNSDTLVPTRYQRYWHGFNGLMRNYIVPTIGGVWLAISGVGFFAEPLKEIAAAIDEEEYIRYPVAATLAAPSIYLLACLMSFFGSTLLQNVYDYCTSWGPTDTKIPVEVKQNPKIFFLLMLLNAYLNFFGAATSIELIKANFSEPLWDPIRDYLVNIAGAGIRFVGFLAFKDLSLVMLRKLVKYCGGDEKKMMIVLLEKFDQLKTMIFQLNGDLFENALKAMPPEQRQTCLGMNDDEFNALINHRENFLNSYKVRYFPFFKRKLTDKEKQTLENQLNYIEAKQSLSVND